VLFHSNEIRETTETGSVMFPAARKVTMLLGIDVSHYTGPRDWRGIAEKGPRFAFVKATEGATVRDDLFARHWRGMHEAGIPCGAYHYGHPGSDAAA
jgi:GH25 family lysozyme M1 (1,4-beta-N-acetylmuramidase)